MSLNRMMSLEHTCRSGRLVTATVVLLASGALMPSLVGTAGGRLTEEVPAICETETWQSLADADALVGPHDRRLRMRLSRAVTLFRFGRVQDALRKLETAVEMVAQIVDSRVSPERRKSATTNIERLQACLKATPVPALATIIVRPLPPAAERKMVGDRPIADAYVRVEDLPVGETGQDGTLRVRVPSGAITV